MPLLKTDEIRIRAETVQFLINHFNKVPDNIVGLLMKVFYEISYNPSNPPSVSGGVPYIDTRLFYSYIENEPKNVVSKLINALNECLANDTWYGKLSVIRLILKHLEDCTVTDNVFEKIVENILQLIQGQGMFAKLEAIELLISYLDKIQNRIKRDFASEIIQAFQDLLKNKNPKIRNDSMRAFCVYFECVLKSDIKDKMIDVLQNLIDSSDENLHLLTLEFILGYFRYLPDNVTSKCLIMLPNLLQHPNMDVKLEALGVMRRYFEGASSDVNVSIIGAVGSLLIHKNCWIQCRAVELCISHSEKMPETLKANVMQNTLPSLLTHDNDEVKLEAIELLLGFFDKISSLEIVNLFKKTLEDLLLYGDLNVKLNIAKALFRYFGKIANLSIIEPLEQMLQKLISDEDYSVILPTVETLMICVGEIPENIVDTFRQRLLISSKDNSIELEPRLYYEDLFIRLLSIELSIKYSQTSTSESFFVTIIEVISKVQKESKFISHYERLLSQLFAVSTRELVLEHIENLLVLLKHDSPNIALITAEFFLKYYNNIPSDAVTEICKFSKTLLAYGENEHNVQMIKLLIKYFSNLSDEFSELIHDSLKKLLLTLDIYPPQEAANLMNEFAEKAPDNIVLLDKDFLADKNFNHPPMSYLLGEINRRSAAQFFKFYTLLRFPEYYQKLSLKARQENMTIFCIENSIYYGQHKFNKVTINVDDVDIVEKTNAWLDYEKELIEMSGFTKEKSMMIERPYPLSLSGSAAQYFQQTVRIYELATSDEFSHYPNQVAYRKAYQKLLAEKRDAVSFEAMHSSKTVIFTNVSISSSANEDIQAKPTSSSATVNQQNNEDQRGIRKTNSD